MYAASAPVSTFIARHPTTKMLALAFLVLIGVALVADGFEFHIHRGYIYFAMAFAGAVEALNVMVKRSRGVYCGPVLRHPAKLMLPAVDLGGQVWLGGKPCKGGPAAPAFGG